MASFFVASKIIIFITVCVYVLTGNELSAGTVFMAICLYGAVRLTITLFFPFAIEKLSESLISIRRIKVSVCARAVGLLCNLKRSTNVRLLLELSPAGGGRSSASRASCGREEGLHGDHSGSNQLLGHGEACAGFFFF